MAASAGRAGWIRLPPALHQRPCGAAATKSVPTNSKVKMTGEISTVLAKDADELKKKFVFQDWKTINQQRGAWIERFRRAREGGR